MPFLFYAPDRNLGDLGIFHRLIKFPHESTILGTMLRDFTMQNRFDIPGTSAPFMFASNRWEQQPQMKSNMLDGMSIIVDRYSHSGAAYEIARVSALFFRFCFNLSFS